MMNEIEKYALALFNTTQINDNTFSCDKCNLSFPSLNVALEHYIEQHIDESD